MLLFVALGVIIVTWMVSDRDPGRNTEAAAKPVFDAPLALAIVGLAPSWFPGSHCDDRTERKETVTNHKIGTREEWLVARLELLEAE